MTVTPRQPARYRLRVDGHLDDHWSTSFGALVLTRESDGTTTLSGPVADQAELHGLLTKVRDLGVTLISVALVDQCATKGCFDDGSTLGSHATKGCHSGADEIEEH